MFEVEYKNVFKIEYWKDKDGPHIRKLINDLNYSNCIIFERCEFVWATYNI